MDAWEQPHWSGKPQPAPDIRPRLRPNGFARLARVCARHNGAVLLLMVFACALSVTFSALTLTIDPHAVSRIALDPQTLAAQQRLDSNFPGIDTTFVARVDNKVPGAARSSAVAIATTLAKRTDLFARAFVPGTGTYYTKYGFLFRDAGDIDARVAQALRMQPLYQALGAAPDIGGLAALVTEIGNAVAQGRSPPGLAGLLLAVSAAVEGEIAGESRPIYWPQLAGLSAEMDSTRWFVIATPVMSREREAAGLALAAVKAVPDAIWSFPQQAYGRAGNIVRNLVVPAMAAVLIAFTVLGIGLGAVKFVVPVLVTVAATLCLTAGAAALASPDLDAVSWFFVAACLAPAFLFSLVLVLAHIQARAHGSAPLAAIMLASQRRGWLLVALAVIAEILWTIWLIRQLPSLAQLAEIAGLGTIIALVLTLTLVPAFLGALDREGGVAVHWLDAAAAAPAGSHGRNGLQVSALLLIAASLFCAVFVPGLRFGDAMGPVLPGSALDTPAAQGAVHLLAKDEALARQLAAAAAKLPETGAIRTIEQFLPAGKDRKLSSLKLLEGYLPGVPAPRDPLDQAALGTAFTTLQASLKQIADERATAPDLRDAAHRLRRAVGLYSSPALPSAARVMALEDALFSGLGELSWNAEQLARLPNPGLADLDEALRRRFVSAGGLLRIEVLPKPGAGRLAFAAAMRKLQPLAAGTPVVALARNEIMHHEAAIAVAMAFAALAAVTLVLLRNLLDWMVAMVPVGLALCLSAAVIVGTGQVIASSSLGAAMTAMAMCLSSSIILVLRARQANGAASPADTAFRAALLPPLVVLATVAPLAMSGTAPVAAVGLVSTLFLGIAIIVSMVAVPQLCAWGQGLRGR
jgi:uncharacterized protein